MLPSYYYQTADMLCDTELSDSVRVQQGLRHGCVSSPDLFVLYTEMIMRENTEQ